MPTVPKANSMKLVGSGASAAMTFEASATNGFKVPVSGPSGVTLNPPPLMPVMAIDMLIVVART